MLFKKKEYREICRVCYKTIPERESAMKIKQKLVFEDIDGFWAATKSVWVCNSCIQAIREQVKVEV